MEGKQGRKRKPKTQRTREKRHKKGDESLHKIPQSNDLKVNSLIEKFSGLAIASEITDECNNTLPGPPITPWFEVIEPGTVQIEWELPIMSASELQITGYVVEMKIGTDSSTTERHSLKSNRVVISELDENKTYDFRIYACNDIGKGERPLEYSIELPTLSAPYQPTNLKVTKLFKNGVKLSWKAPFRGEKLSGYSIEKCQLYSDQWQNAGEVTSDFLYYTVDRLEENTYYTFRVFAFNTAGYSEPTTNYIYSKTKGETPFPPSTLQITSLATNEVQLNWKRPFKGEKPTGYSIEMCKHGSSWEKLDQVNADCFSYIVSDLTDNTNYDFRVSSVNNSGSSNPTEMYNVCTAKTFKSLKTEPGITAYKKEKRTENTDKKKNSGSETFKQTKPTSVMCCKRTCNSRVHEISLILKCGHSFCFPCSKEIYETPWTMNEGGAKSVDLFLCPTCGECTERSFLQFPQGYLQFKKNQDASLYYNDSGTSSTAVQHSNFSVKDDSPIQGLPNIGLTCYANSIFQVLAQTPYLMTHLRKIMNKNDLDKDRSLSGYLLKVLMNVNKQTTITDIYENVQCLVDKVCSSDMSFRLWEQNDSHSFLMALFNAVKKELCADQDSSIILPMFEGYMANRFLYKPCNHTEYSEEQMFTSLLIPMDNIKDKAMLTEGINSLTNEERFEDNVLPCRICKVSNDNTVAIKTLEIVKRPEILILQLGKFRQDQNRLAKIYKTFTLEPVLSIQEHPIGLDGNPPKQRKKEERVYKLYGVTLHSGTIDGGHYAAYVKYTNKHGVSAEDQWYECSDSFVTQININAILQDRRAFLLFYHLSRRNV